MSQFVIDIVKTRDDRSSEFLMLVLFGVPFLIVEPALAHGIGSLIQSNERCCDHWTSQALKLQTMASHQGINPKRDLRSLAKSAAVSQAEKTCVHQRNLRPNELNL